MDRIEHRRRLRLSVAGLAIVWALSFAAPLLPFFPTVLVGGVLAGTAGLWVRRALPEGGPAWRVHPLWLLVAVVAAALHYILGTAAFRAVADLWDGWLAAAAEIYTRTGEVPLAAQLVMAAAITAPLEEVFWRGAAHPSITAGEPSTTRRVVGGALAYAAFHVVTLQAPLVAAAALGGLLWGWLAERSGSVTVPMVAHATWTAAMIAWPP